MEDPEARRARLKAMREEAQGVTQSADPIPDNSTAKLANPFEDAAPTSDAHTPRFNYYSNPAAGFVHTKRKEPGQHTRPQWRPKFYPPSPVPPPPVAPLVGGFGSPIPLYHPQQGFAPAPPALEPPQRPGEGTWPIKRPNYGPGRGAGRGRGSGPGRGGFQPGNQARGRGGGGSVSARDRPDLFYQKSMVEDPWRHLLPVMWASQNLTWTFKDLIIQVLSLCSLYVPSPGVKSIIHSLTDEPDEEATAEGSRS